MDGHDRRSFTSACFRLFDIMAKKVYTEKAHLDERNVQAFVAAKVSGFLFLCRLWNPQLIQPLVFVQSSALIVSGRLQFLQRTDMVTLARTRRAHDEPGPKTAPHCPTSKGFVLDIGSILMFFRLALTPDLQYWRTFLAMSNPTGLVLWHSPADELEMPSVTRTPLAYLEFAQAWDRFASLHCFGLGSVPLQARPAKGSSDRIALSISDGKEASTFLVRRWLGTREVAESSCSSVADALQKLKVDLDGRETLLELRGCWWVMTPNR
jgi:hypothetical protein